MEKQILITACITPEPRELGHRIFLSQLFPQNNSDYYRNRYNESTQKLTQQKSSSSNYATFKCQVKKSDSNNEKENNEKLPTIYCPRKYALVDKYFSRNDIVKDRSQQMGRVSSKCLNENTANQSTQNNNKYKKVQSRSVHIERISKSKTNHNQMVETIGQKLFTYQKPYKLQQQMKKWALIKKKNEYQVFKLIRKNNYQRMKSNMIIAQAMKELLDKREQLLAKEETSKEFYTPLDESHIVELQK